MSLYNLENDLRHYRRQHRENVRWRNRWINFMGQRTGMARWYEERAAQCRTLARETIERIKELRK